MENTNLEILKKSRKKIKPGDIFVLKPIGHDFYFGRVVRIDANCGFGPSNAVLIYIYNSTSKAKEDVPYMDKNDLFLPPILINQLPWSRGYFENVASSSLTKDNVFEIHCFYDPLTHKYIDDNGNFLDDPKEPIGEYGLASYRVVDDMMSEKLGLPLAPD